MYFQHAPEIWRDFPELVPGVVLVEGVHPGVSAAAPVEAYVRVAQQRLAGGPESELPAIQAWRRAYSRMGLKPTQYRCAAESLLRRLRREGALPRLHPMVDLCNGASLAYSVPVAALDVSRIAGDLAVRYATGSERYVTFGGEVEHPDPHEVIFADADAYAHARRWTNRQSGRSAVRDETSTVLVVAEALHASAHEDVTDMLAALAADIAAVWSVEPRTALLSAEAPRFQT